MECASEPFQPCQARHSCSSPRAPCSTPTMSIKRVPHGDISSSLQLSHLAPCVCDALQSQVHCRPGSSRGILRRFDLCVRTSRRLNPTMPFSILLVPRSSPSFLQPHLGGFTLKWKRSIIKDEPSMSIRHLSTRGATKRGPCRGKPPPLRMQRRQNIGKVFRAWPHHAVRGHPGRGPVVR